LAVEVTHKSIKGIKRMITLKNVKHCEFASHETDCFEASLYFNGKKVGFTYNDGYGGPTEVDFVSSEAEEMVDAWVKSQPDEEFESGGKTYTVGFSLDIAIGEALDKFLRTKELKGKMRSKLIIVCDDSNDGKFYQVKRSKNFDDSFMFDRIKSANPKMSNPVCLNLLPIEKAVELWAAV